MDPSSWAYYNRLQQQVQQVQQQPAAAELQQYATQLQVQQLRQVAEQQQQAQAQHHQTLSQYTNMGLPPSLVQAAASKQAAAATQQHQLFQQQALASAGVLQGIGSASTFQANSLLTPPQTPSSTPWKSFPSTTTSSNGPQNSVGVAAGGLVIVPEPHKADPRPRHERSFSSQEILTNGQQQVVSRSGARAGVSQAVEVKSSQPIFPGQSPSSARATDSYGTPTPQPPPRQSSQPPSRSSTNSNRSAFPGQTPTNLEFREPYSQLQHHSQQPSDGLSRQQPSPSQQAQQKVAQHLVQNQSSPQSYYNNPSPQNVASPQSTGYYGQNQSPHNNSGQSATEQYYAQQAAAAAAQQQQLQQQQAAAQQAQHYPKSRSTSSTSNSRHKNSSSNRSAERNKTNSSSRSNSHHSTNTTNHHQLNLSAHSTQQQAVLLQQQQQQQAAAQAQALAQREQQERERLERERQLREEQQKAQILAHHQQQQQHQQLLQQQQQQQQRELQIKQEREQQQLTAAAQAAAAQASQPQDLGLARLGALGALADLADGAVGGGDLLNEVPSTINYEDLVIGNQAAAHAGATTVGHNFTSQQQAGHVSHQSQSRHGSTHQRSSISKNRAGDLLDLSSGDNRNNTPNNVEGVFNQQQHQQAGTEQGKEGNLIPQIVMNPWDPNQAPVMTMVGAPLANVMQAYQQQWLMQAQAGGSQNSDNNTNSGPNAQQQNSNRQSVGQPTAGSSTAAEKEEESYRERVLCVAPDEEMGFLLNLPPPCNVLLQPSSVGISGKPRESPFNISFQKFLKGEVVTPKPVPEPDKYPNMVEEKVLPGKKAYIPPYTPKSALRNSASFQRQQMNHKMSQKNGGGMRNYNSSQRSGSNSRSSSSASNYMNQFGKNKRSRDSDDDESFGSNAVLPKRETSKRAAKEKVSAKMKNHLAEEEEEGVLPGLDLSDSDDDATWTPFRNKEERDRPVGVPNVLNQGVNQAMKKRPYDSDDYYNNTKKARTDGGKSGLIGTTTNFVPNGQDLKTGDFVVEVTDADRESAPIWRLDSKTLLQRYNPIQGEGGEYLHKSAHQFKGFVPASREKYVSVSVKFVHVDGNSFTVRVVKGGSQDPELRMRSRAETQQFQENFEVYIQALISQCLDSNFLDEVFNDQDEYFVSNIEKVDSVTLLRKDKVMTGVSWSLRFQQAISTWPSNNDLGSAAVQETMCGACERERASTMVQMYGQPYNQNTLKPVPPGETASLHRNFSVCKKCSRLAALFHRLHHQKHRMYSNCVEVVEGRKKAVPNLDTTKILNELLANDKWLEQQFKRMQDLWADADTFVR